MIPVNSAAILDTMYRQGVGTTELARRAKTSHHTITALLEQRRPVARIGTVYKLARALNVDHRIFIGSVENAENSSCQK